MRGIMNVRKYKGARKFSNILKTGGNENRANIMFFLPPVPPPPRKLEVYENFNNNEEKEEEKNRGYPFPSSLFIFPVWPWVKDPGDSSFLACVHNTYTVKKFLLVADRGTLGVLRSPPFVSSVRREPEANQSIPWRFIFDLVPNIPFRDRGSFRFSTEFFSEKKSKYFSDGNEAKRNLMNR